MKTLILLSFSLCLTTACSLNTKKQDYSFDSELSQFEYPFKIQRFHFSSQRKKLQMSYGDLAPQKTEKVVLLLHGKNFAGYYWNKIAKELIEKGYRVIIPDQIGFGKSSKPAYYQYSFSQLVLNTMKLMDHLEIKNYQVVGHSMGGMLATHLTQQDSRVEKLVLINPIGLEDYLKYVEIKDPEFFFSIEKNKSVEQFRNYQKKNYYDGKWSPRYEALLTPFKGWKNGPDWEIVAWNNALTYGPIFAEEIVSSFKDLEVPVVLVLGTRDRTGPGRNWKKKGVDRKLGQYQNLGSEIKALNPKRITLLELKGLGHMPQFEDYKKFSKVFYPLF